MSSKKTSQFNNGLPTWRMVKLSEQDRAGAVGYVQSGSSIRHMSQQYSMCHPPLSVGNLIRRYNETGNGKDRPRSRRP